MTTPDTNKKFARTEINVVEERWYILDNAAAFMPALTNRTLALVFRIALVLKERVHIDILAQAMGNISHRFSYYHVELRRGFFWYYLEPLNRTLKPVADSRYPCMHMHVLRRHEPLFRVRVFGSRVAVEFCHVLADGSGALVYLKALVLEYFTLSGRTVQNVEGIFTKHEEPDPEESEDAFNRFFKNNFPFPEKVPKAFHRPVAVLGYGKYRITCGIVPLDLIRAKGKEYGCTLNEYLVSVYMAVLQDLFYALPSRIRKWMKPLITVEVPVNLRNFYPCKTMRNFSLYILPFLDTRLGFYDFQEIVKRVRSFMQSELNEKNLSRQISRNVKTGRSLGVRMLPLVLKDIVARLVYKHIGEDTVTGFLSNLGSVSMPQELCPLIERFEFIPTPSYQCKTNVNVVSWENKLVLNFGSVAANTELERLFFARLVEDGIPVSVGSNMDTFEYAIKN